MRVLVSILTILTTSIARAADAPVEVIVQPAGSPTVIVRATGEPVHLPSCRGLSWEAFDARTQRYQPLSTGPCGPLQPAESLDKSGTEFILDADPGGAQVVRAIVVVGRGCTSGKPFPLAGCREVVAVEGPPINLKGGTGEAAPGDQK